MNTQYNKKTLGICPMCGNKISVNENQDASTCPICNEAFITEKSINAFAKSIKGFTPALCTNCNEIIKVDPNKEAEKCYYCNKPYITEKVISNYKDRFNMATYKKIFTNSSESKDKDISFKERQDFLNAILEIDNNKEVIEEKFNNTLLELKINYIFPYKPEDLKEHYDNAINIINAVPTLEKVYKDKYDKAVLEMFEREYEDENKIGLGFVTFSFDKDKNINTKISLDEIKKYIFNKDLLDDIIAKYENLYEEYEKKYEYNSKNKEKIKSDVNKFQAKLEGQEKERKKVKETIEKRKQWLGILLMNVFFFIWIIVDLIKAEGSRGVYALIFWILCFIILLSIFNIINCSRIIKKSKKIINENIFK